MLGESSASIYFVNARDSTKDGLCLPTFFLIHYTHITENRKQNIFKWVIYIIKMIWETITIPKIEYEKLKMKAEIADDASIQLKLSLEDLRHERASLI